jgi:hypothetical protein
MVWVNTANKLPDYFTVSLYLTCASLCAFGVFIARQYSPPNPSIHLRAEISLNRGVITNDDRYESNQTVGADEVLVWSVLAHLAMVLSFPQHANKVSQRRCCL